MVLKRPVYLCSVALARSGVDCSGVAVKTGPGLGSISMQIVRDARINKATDNKGNLYGDPFMA